VKNKFKIGDIVTLSTFYSPYGFGVVVKRNAGKWPGNGLVAIRWAGNSTIPHIHSAVFLEKVDLFEWEKEMFGLILCGD
jgi:hypothetical protein